MGGNTNKANDKWMISKIYKQLMTLSIKKKLTQSKRGQNTMENSVEIP